MVKKKKLGFCEGCIPTGLEEGTVEEKRPREGRLARNLEAPPPPPPAAGFEESDNGAATAAEDPSMARAVLLLEVPPGPGLIFIWTPTDIRYRRVKESYL